MKFHLPSIPAPVNTISGLNGALPQVYNTGWQIYTDLSPEQIAAFQSFPDWSVVVANHNAWIAANVTGPSTGVAILLK